MDIIKCPLSGKIFMDPVTTQYGHTYERDALLKYMERNNNLDPKAKLPVDPDKLVPQKAIREMAENFRKSNLL